MSTSHPIELFIAAFIYMAEGVCWVINELAGHHQPTTVDSTASKQATYQRWKQEIISLTVKQLREMTGIKSSRYNKQALQQVALAGVTSYLY